MHIIKYYSFQYTSHQARLKFRDLSQSDVRAYSRSHPERVKMKTTQQQD